MVDVNKPIENPEFVVTMETLQKTPSKDSESAFFDQLRQANFLLILHQGIDQQPDEAGRITLTKGTTISFPMLSGPDDRPMHFGFTDWDALYRWRNEPNQQTLIVPFDQLVDLVLQDGSDCAGFLINPSSQNFFIPRHILAQITGRIDAYTVKKNTQVMLGEPKNYPHELVAAVKAALKPMKQVKRAWLMLMIRDNVQSYLIVAEHTGSRDTVSQTIGNAAKSHLPPGMFVDIVTTDQDFGKTAVQGKQPFFKRGLFG